MQGGCMVGHVGVRVSKFPELHKRACRIRRRAEIAVIIIMTVITFCVTI